MYDYRCEYCTGTVRPRTVEQEVFRHPRGFVMLEQVTIGVCDMCGNRYYSADLLHQVEELAAAGEQGRTYQQSITGRVSLAFPATVPHRIAPDSF